MFQNQAGEKKGIDVFLKLINHSNILIYKILVYSSLEEINLISKILEVNIL